MKKTLIVLLSIFLYSCNNINNDTYIKSNISSSGLDIIINQNLYQFNNIDDSKEDIKEKIENNGELFIDFGENISIENIKNILSNISLNQKFLKISFSSNQFGDYLKQIIKDKNISDFIIEIRDCSEKININKDFGEIILNNKLNRLELSCTNIPNDKYGAVGIFIIDKEQKNIINNLDNVIINNFY